MAGGISAAFLGVESEQRGKAFQEGGYDSLNGDVTLRNEARQ